MLCRRALHSCLALLVAAVNLHTVPAFATKETPKWFVLRSSEIANCWTALLVRIDGAYRHDQRGSPAVPMKRRLPPESGERSWNKPALAPRASETVLGRQPQVTRAPLKADDRGSPMPGDAQTAYLFQCGDEELFAVSPDKAGKNIPRSSCTRGWLLRQEFQLGAQDPVPTAISPEPVRRSIGDKGYYIWRVGCLSA